MDIELVLDAHAIIGESPTWSPVERVLYWIDVKEPALHRYDPESGACRHWTVTSDLGAFALMEENAALVALRYGIHRLDLATGALDLLAPPPFDPTLFRFNEGICDRTGRFWVGVMFDPIAGSPPPQRASLHSFTLQHGFIRQDDDAELHNGMAWSADEQRLFLSHSNAGVIHVFRFDPASGTLGPTFAHIPAGLGLPDGAAIDAEGCYWCAVHGGARLHRYRPDGQLDREIPLPVSKPTMCAFAGNDLDSLYVTSASDGMNSDQLCTEPHAGALFRLGVSVKGIARPHTVR
ncbi:SMP-30/gluconolactonase/LRE family protein [Bradyrhizobium sp.]|uniref:SMP-30/gluconolactonase/LRE family protein n=1 Tax=Bradyrhizobium sp. TaxID=376 RepID=UPI00260ADF05|nr:SMP-30/gluconolactonase/LRE family protein [Bradyrhizobium sp.]